jgi:hypothetical protein
MLEMKKIKDNLKNKLGVWWTTREKRRNSEVSRKVQNMKELRVEINCKKNTKNLAQSNKHQSLMLSLYSSLLTRRAVKSS